MRLRKGDEEEETTGSRRGRGRHEKVEMRYRRR
jgi:hypothetical protein